MVELMFDLLGCIIAGPRYFRQIVDDFLSCFFDPPADLIRDFEIYLRGGELWDLVQHSPSLKITIRDGIIQSIYLTSSIFDAIQLHAYILAQFVLH